MQRRMRIIYKESIPTFTQRLVSQARTIVSKSKSQDDSGLAGLVDEIALVLSQLEGTRTLHINLQRHVTLLECYIGTEIIQREPRTAFFYDHRIGERDMLRARLLTLEAERRRLLIIENNTSRDLESRLQSLISRAKLLDVRQHPEG